MMVSFARSDISPSRCASCQRLRVAAVAVGNTATVVSAEGCVHVSCRKTRMFAVRAEQSRNMAL